MDHAILVPVKALAAAKARLRGHVSDAGRARLARFLADGVLDAAATVPTFVACDDDEIATWASGRGAKVLWGPGLGLNGAVDQGVATIGELGFERVTIVHGDLPLPADIAGLGRAAGPTGIMIVPDRRRDGTNVLSRPCGVALPAQYGAGSYVKHLESARATARPVTVRFDERLALDIDTIEDCRHPLVADLLAPLLTD